ncbi:MAG: hypothetical protein MI922_03305, partial [Bacteroidales bacterium]|nr:hypothetical protein [Bacteroidales bacterium]
NAGEEIKPVTVEIEIHEANNPSKVVYATTDKQELEKGNNTITWNINTPDAKIWDINNPNLYYIHFNIYGENKKLLHSVSERFGYRWFEVTGQGSDAQFRLNGKRIVLRTAISWGYYPVNGMYATPEMARRHVQAAKDIGLNMLSFHRGMGCEIVLDMADEIGLLYYAEPGGYTAGRKAKGDEFIRDWVSEKWLRMVKSMRNHPSLVIYNMINEQADTPDKRNHEDMALAHEIDPSRVMTYVSGWVVEGKKELKKLHMLPFDTTQYHYGWFDFHHARGWGSLQELHYRNSETFFLNSNDKEEIVFYGEEGAIAVPPLLEKAVARYDASGKEGWDGTAYRSWLDAYKNYLKEKDWNQYYPTVDGLIQQMGELSHYYQGRIIENVRISDVLDGYAVNGYECERNENHSGVVDVFRNPKTDPKLMSHYAQPLYVALKARNKIGHVDEHVIIDAFVVNEVDLKGEFTLRLNMDTPNGNNEMVVESKVQVTGGDVYGELISKAITIP